MTARPHQEAPSAHGATSIRKTARLSRSAPEPLYYQVSQAVIRGVSEGRLKPGQRLPSEPRVAADLGVNPGTVCNAWAYLEKKGLLRRRRGQGTFIV